MLEALFTESPVGLHLIDTELRVVRLNTGTAAMRDVSAEDLVGTRFIDTYRLADPAGVEALARGVLETGRPVRQRLVVVRPDPASARERFHEVSMFRLRDSRGKVLGLAISAVDVTERERTRARIGVLASVRESVGRTMDVAITCQELVDTLVPGFADVAVVEVVDAVARGDDPPLTPLPRGVPLLRTAFRSSSGDPDPPQAHPVGDVRSLPAPTPYTQALVNLRPRALVLSADLPWLVADPARAAAIRESGAHTLLTVPLTLRGTVLGLVSLYRTRQPEPYDDDDAALALELAEHTALCIDNARRYTREHAVAATVRRYLMPQRPTSHTALETAHVEVSAEGGGGWYDTIALSSARTALVVGHVSGQGINAIATMGQLRTVVRSLSGFDLEPDEMLARLNDVVGHVAAERAALPPDDPLHRETLTAGCLYAVYDPLTLTCTVAVAGTPGPVVALPDGTVTVPDVPIGPLLGSADSTPFATASFEAPSGSVLAFAGTPVLTPSPFGDPHLLQAAPAHAGRPLQDLCDDILYTLTAGTAPRDVTLLLARTRPFPAERSVTWRLPHDPTAAATARRHVRAALSTWNVHDDTAFDTDLIVSELVTNAVRYGSPPIELRLINDRTLTCEIRDTSLVAPRLRHARTADEGGRGLFIVARLAQAWGTRYTADDKTIWAEQTLPSPSL
jgi:PAS domain S-box-containing protein